MYSSAVQTHTLQTQHLSEPVLGFTEVHHYCNGLHHNVQGGVLVIASTCCLLSYTDVWQMKEKTWINEWRNTINL